MNRYEVPVRAVSRTDKARGSAEFSAVTNAFDKRAAKSSVFDTLHDRSYDVQWIGEPIYVGAV